MPANRHALLMIFQAMDTAGKDGAIKHVMSGVNARGCQVFSFRHPSAGELEHDFPWRTTRALPQRGHIGKNARLIISSILHEQLRGLGMQYPKIDAQQRQALKRIRRLLAT